jgi:cardiolipin synthase
MSSSINYRDHRKIIVVDGNIAFTGGINFADEYINENIRFGIWKDGGIRLIGHGVFNFTMMFLNMWEILNRTTDSYEKYIPTISKETDGFVLPFPDGPLDGNQTTGNVYLKIISSATKYVYITTPYLILDNELLVGLKIAAMSGVDVRIITPNIPDKRVVFIVTKSYYRELINAGVKIYQYTPGFIHTKSIISDDVLGIVGTANFDFRSLYLHFEDSCLLYKNSSLINLRNDFLETVAISKKIEKEDLKKEGIIKKFVLAILKVFSPLM